MKKAPKPRSVGGARAPTLQDIADQVGFSPSTVSAVLNDSPRAQTFYPETKDRIREAAQQLGYVANPLAKTLRRTRSGLLGLVMFSQHSVYYDAWLQAADECARELGYEIVPADMGYDMKRLDRCVNMLEAWRVEGLFLMTGGRPLTPVALAALESLGVPLIKAGLQQQEDTCSSLAFNNFEGGRLLAQHLIELGHKRIGVIAPNPTNRQSEDRLRGLAAALERQGIALPDTAIVRAFDADVGLAAGHRYAALLLEANPSVTAIVCMNDPMAIGTLRKLGELGLRTPQQVSVAGFDDLCLGGAQADENRLGAYLVPSLTTIRTPRKEVGMLAIKMLVEMIRNEELRGVKRTVEFPPELIIRESTGPAPA